MGVDGGLGFMQQVRKELRESKANEPIYVGKEAYELYGKPSSGTTFRPCCQIHPGDSCTCKSVKSLIKVFIWSIPIYLPVYLVPILLFKRNKLFRNGQTFRKIMRKLVKKVLRSCLFLSMYDFLFSASLCFFRNLSQEDVPVSSVLCGLINGSAIILESQSRRSELTLFCFPRALEIFWASSGLRAVLKPLQSRIHLVETVLFALSMAVIMYCARYESKNIKPTYRHALRLIYGF